MPEPVVCLHRLLDEPETGGSVLGMHYSALDVDRLEKQGGMLLGT